MAPARNIRRRVGVRRKVRRSWRLEELADDRKCSPLFIGDGAANLAPREARRNGDVEAPVLELQAQAGVEKPLVRCERIVQSQVAEVALEKQILTRPPSRVGAAEDAQGAAAR